MFEGKKVGGVLIWPDPTGQNLDVLSIFTTNCVKPWHGITSHEIGA